MYVLPYLLCGSAITTIGAGWVYTLDIDSTSSHWIGYQVIIGMGIGIAVQIPIIANQACVDLSQISSVSAMTLCKWHIRAFQCEYMILKAEIFSNVTPVFQTLGGAFSVSAAQSAFENRLLARVPVTVPSIDPALVLATGATELRQVFSAVDIPRIVEAYMDGLKVSFALVIALAVVSIPIALCAKWQIVKPKM